MPPGDLLLGLDHVQLAAPPGSEELLRRYYAGVLGMTEIAKPPRPAARGGCWFRSRGPHGTDEPAGVTLHLGVEPDFRPARKAHPGILVRGLDALAARLARAGAPVRWDDALPGYRRCYSEDPVGNRLEFLEPVEPVEPVEPPDCGPAPG